MDFLPPEAAQAPASQFVFGVEQHSAKTQDSDRGAHRKTCSELLDLAEDTGADPVAWADQMTRFI